MDVNPAIVSLPSKAIDTLSYEAERSPLVKEIRYINNLGEDIVVLDRRGIEFKIPSRFNPSNKSLEFKIVEGYTIGEDVTVNFSNNEQDKNVGDYRQNLLDSLHMDSKARRNTRKCIVETVIKKTDLSNYNNAVYIKEHDIVIYIPKMGITVVHPTTVSLILNGLRFKERADNSFNFNVKINDPRNKIGSRFLNISGMIYELVPERDSSQVEGVVVSSTTPEGEVVHVPMSLEEFEKNIRSYRSYEEAETLGNIEESLKAQRTEEVETIRHQNTVEAEKLKSETLRAQREADKTKQELLSIQTQLKTQETEHKKQLEIISAKLDEEKSHREWESLQRKSYYEERSYDRKDSSELIKFLPMIIGAGLVLLFK